MVIMVTILTTTIKGHFFNNNTVSIQRVACLLHKKRSQSAIVNATLALLLLVAVLSVNKPCSTMVNQETINNYQWLNAHGLQPSTTNYPTRTININHQQSTSNKSQTTINKQPSTINIKHQQSTINNQHSTININYQLPSIHINKKPSKFEPRTNNHPSTSIKNYQLPSIHIIQKPSTIGLSQATIET